MVVEVHNVTRSPAPHRALIGTLTLLLFTGALAAQLTSSRGRSPLGLTVAPEGWLIEFRPPKGFEIGVPVSSGPMTMLPLYAGDDEDTTLTAWRFEIPGLTDSKSVGLMIMSKYSERGQEAEGTVSPDRTFGPFQAAQWRSPDGRAAVRVAVPVLGEAYALALHRGNGPLDERWMQVFERTCASVVRQNRRK